MGRALRRDGSAAAAAGSGTAPKGTVDAFTTRVDYDASPTRAGSRLGGGRLRRAASGGAASGAQRGGGGPLAGGGEGGEGHDEDEEDYDARWRRRLREECSDGEREGPSEEADGWRGAQGPERTGQSDDEWADRLWRDMQRRRSAAAAASAAAFTADLRAENARRAAEAAERSRRILRDEQAKDADWRRRTLAAIEAGPSTPQLDLTAARVSYDERWAQLDGGEAAAATGGPTQAPPPPPAPLRYWDIPWPLEPPTAAGPAPGPGPAAAVGPPPPPAPAPAPSSDALRDFLLLGASGPSDVKRRLRAELLRWHPDKFGARFGARLAAGGGGAAHRSAALARVQQVAQVLTQVLGRGGAA